ncbi:hypothetical protein PENTCL1PPCAC_14580, partial [Pristionchus entomophagus]
ISAEMDYTSTVNALQQELFHNYRPSMAPLHSRGYFNDSFIEHFSMMISFAKMTTVVRNLKEYTNALFDIQNWTDPRLIWIPAKYGGIRHLYLTIDQIWFPNFHACSSSSMTYLTTPNIQAAKVLFDGSVSTLQQVEVTYS